MESRYGKYTDASLAKPLSACQDMNESIPEDDDHNIQYPLYYEGTTSHDYEMACYVLGNKSVTIQELNAVYAQEDAENDD